MSRRGEWPKTEVRAVRRGDGKFMASAEKPRTDRGKMRRRTRDGSDISAATGAVVATAPRPWPYSGISGIRQEASHAPPR